MDNKQPKQAHTPGPRSSNPTETETWIYDADADVLLARVIVENRGDPATAKLIDAAPALAEALRALVDAIPADRLMAYKDVALAALRKAGL
jgi:hypothetical protein